MSDTRGTWQISPPAAMGKSIAEYFLGHGVALLWPGDPGPWTPERYTHDYAQRDWMKWFAEAMSVGDAILLRTGSSKIRAVGIAASTYSYENRFDDVHGFDLQHCRRVRWYELPDEYDFGASVFTKGRFSAVKNKTVCKYVRDFLASPPTQWQEAPLLPLPNEERELDKVPGHIEGMRAQALDLAGLYQDRQKFGDYPAEDELVAHFVVPFLRALSWPPEGIAVKWRRVDVAVFSALPRMPENCRFIIEAKRPGGDVEGALNQAKGYLKSLGITRDVVVTDGIRYRLFTGDPVSKPVAYANLGRLKQSATELFDRMVRP